jgi:(p)ppGpp synthase/HD superfamily hydrolase
VSYLVASYKKSKHLEELIVASMLHDTIEDTDATFIEIATTFTPLVASLVLELSNDSEQIKTMGKLEYQKKKLLVCQVMDY